MVDPAATPVTTPEELIVAVDVLEDVHGDDVFAVPEPVKVILLPIHTAAEPVIVGAVGSVRVMVLTCLQEFLSVTVMVCDPAGIPVISSVVLVLEGPDQE